MKFKHLFATQSDYYRQKALKAPFITLPPFIIPLLILIIYGFIN